MYWKPEGKSEVGGEKSHLLPCSIRQLLLEYSSAGYNPSPAGPHQSPRPREQHWDQGGMERRGMCVPPSTEANPARISLILAVVTAILSCRLVQDQLGVSAFTPHQSIKVEILLILASKENPAGLVSKAPFGHGCSKWQQQTKKAWLVQYIPRAQGPPPIQVNPQTPTEFKGSKPEPPGCFWMCQQHELSEQDNYFS